MYGCRSPSPSGQRNPVGRVRAAVEATGRKAGGTDVSNALVVCVGKDDEEVARRARRSAGRSTSEDERPAVPRPRSSKRAAAMPERLRSPLPPDPRPLRPQQPGTDLRPGRDPAVLTRSWPTSRHSGSDRLTCGFGSDRRRPADDRGRRLYGQVSITLAMLVAAVGMLAAHWKRRCRRGPTNWPRPTGSGRCSPASRLWPHGRARPWTQQGVVVWAGHPPPTARARRAPLSSILPTCSAIVHHGGAGTALTALALGVFQLVIPQFADQPANATVVAARGVGLALLPTSATRRRYGRCCSSCSMCRTTGGAPRRYAGR